MWDAHHAVGLAEDNRLVVGNIAGLAEAVVRVEAVGPVEAAGPVDPMKTTY